MTGGPIPLTREDLPALLRLAQRSLPLDAFSEALLHRWLFDDPRRAAELSLGIPCDEGLAAAAIGLVRTAQDGQPHGWIKLFAVDPEHRRQGLATRLLQVLEAGFRDRGAVQIDTTGFPRYLWPGVDVRYTPACCWLERCGYQLQRYTVNMEVDLRGWHGDCDAEVARLRQNGLTLQRTDGTSLPGVLAMLREHWPPWADEAPLALVNEPVSLFHVSRERDVVGFAAYDVAMFPGTFGPMGTVPAVRGQGIGRALLFACLADMQRLGYSRCEIAWVGPVAFYADQAGATIHRVFRDYQKPLAT